MYAQGWKIEHSCPQCGGPVVLEETDRIFSCSFCRVRLFISSGGHFRYYIKPPDTISEPLIYVPYWRLKGIVFSLAGHEITSRIIDSSLRGMKAGPLPYSLGVRPQVLKLRYIVPESSGTFIKPDLPFRALAEGDFIPKLPEICHELAKPDSYDLFIGEMVSLIGTPVFIRGNTLFDAILQRPVCPVREAFGEDPAAVAVLPGDEAANVPPGCGIDSPGQVSFMPTLCPQCGWDLEGERDTLVLFCRNCSSAWQAGCGTLENVDFQFLASGVPPAICLPFWRIRARVTGLTLESYADLVRLANLPKKTTEAQENSTLHFWIPAFKTQPNLFMRLARTLTILQKLPAAGPEAPKSPLFPVTLPLSEALESIKVLVASIAVPKKMVLPRIPEMKLSSEGHTLVYLPFALSGDEFVQTEIQMSIQKSALKWGRLI
ncbi:MAG: hypothetical protein AB9866_11250 [Syntrophobacteraceae bacterium]